MSCLICLRDDFTNYKGKNISWKYTGFSEKASGPFLKDGQPYLEFDGVDDYVQARSTSNLDFALPIKIHGDNQSGQSFSIVAKTSVSADNNDWHISSYQNDFGFLWKYGGTVYNRRVNAPPTGEFVYEIVEDGGDIVQIMNGVEIDRFTHSGLPGSNAKIFEGGTLNQDSRFWFKGKIYSFQIGTETFPLSEGTGTTITGSEGTVLDIHGATWKNYETVDFDESCLDGANPCFDAEGMTPGYYEFEYTINGQVGYVYLYVSGSEDAGNPVPTTFCYQGLPLEDPEAESINLEDHFLGASKYNIVYQGGVLPQFDGTNLEISSLAPGEYCFTNVAEKELPAGWRYEDCKDCNDYESVCITIVEPLNAGDNRVIEVCNNVDEIYFQDYLQNNDGIGIFEVLSDDLPEGTLDDEKYEPSLNDVGGSFTIVHLLPHPVAPNCIGTAILEFHIVNCVPEPVCPDDDDLGISVNEATNSTPDDPQWEDMLVIEKTGTYEDSGIIDTDKVYFSNDDGANWTELTENAGYYYVTDDDYYVKLTSAFTTTCSGGAGTGTQRMYNVQLSNGENVQEGQIRTNNGTFNADYVDIEPSDYLQAAGSSASLIAERYFRWDVRHVLNSGWVLHLTRTHFDRGGAGGACPNGIGSFGVHFYSGHRSGKRRILIQRRITYNNGCDAITLEETFEPDLPECEESPSGLGFNIVDPIDLGGGSWIAGSVTCVGSVSGSTSDQVNVYFQAHGSPGFGATSFNCGGSYGLDIGENYIFQRIIQFADCPPIILLRNYQAGASCPTAPISCEKEDANGRARAFRLGNPFNLASDYLQRRIGSGSWVNYTEGTWVNVTGTATVYFRRVATFNNGCAQDTQSCQVTVSPPSHSLTITCVGGNKIAYSASGLPPGGVFLLYRGGVVTTSNWVGNQTEVTTPGNYQVRYKYNQTQYIHSNIVSCGTGGGCNPPTVSISPCSVSGNTMTVPFQTTNVTNISQISASVTPGSGSLVWNSGSGLGTITVNGTPGQSYLFEIDVDNGCDTDYASRNCTIGCSVLTIDNVSCNFSQNRTYFSVYVSPNLSTPPVVTGGTANGGSGNRYDFYVSGTSGTINASHPQACSPVSQSISCTCNDPVISLSATCELDKINYAFNVQNVSNAGSVFEILVNGVVVTNYPNTGTNAYVGSRSVPQGSNNTVQIRTTSACGGTVTSSVVNANCGCNDPGISLTASCSTNSISYSFNVTNEAQVTSNYSVLLNGTPVQTKVKTNSGSYSGTISVTPGTNNTVQISASSQCGGSVTSNTASANCGCPPSSLSISNVTCNSTTQMLSFNINQSNVSGASLTVNGSPVAITANPQSVQGVPGNNTITVTGTDSCASTSLSDSVVYNCGCTLPSINVSATCNTSGQIAYNFTVTNESRTNGNYTLLIDGQPEATITNTSSGTYSGTYQATAGSNYTVRIRVNNKCGTTTQSNQVTTNCACPGSAVSIQNLQCNPTNQAVSFNVNTTNSTVTAKYLNGNLITGSGPWTGAVGSNTVTVNATDNCSGAFLSDTKTITCGCSLLPGVQIDSMTESSGVLTVNFSTTNISASSQITFRGNGVIRPVTVLGGGNWRATFNLNEGNNTIQITVQNNCGTASDNDTYNYTSCVPPSIIKTNETCSNGYLYVYVNAQNLNTQDYSTTPASTILGGGSSRIFRFPYGSGNSINWSITGTNDCGSANISGTSNLCPNVEVDIVTDGCSSSGCADYIFMMDTSGSISGDESTPGTEFYNFVLTIGKTIDEIEASGVDARYAIAQFSDNNISQVDVTQYYTSNPAVAKNIVRRDGGGIAYLSESLNILLSDSGLTPRVGCDKHLLIFTDDFGRITPFGPRNTWRSNGWHISVIKYPISDDSASIPQYAATASYGGSYTGSVTVNPGDPDSGAKPRRLYLQSGFTGDPIPGLVDDVLETTCTLKAYVSGCLSAGSYSWSASGGGSIISGQGTDTIVTNGTGSYTVTVTTNGCNIQDTYNF